MKLPKVHHGFLLQQEGSDYFLIDTDKGGVFQINQTTARIFDACVSGQTYESLVEALALGLEPGQGEHILADVKATVQQMVVFGICQ